jgi:hypothetical protein
MRHLVPGFFGEGPTDRRFLEPLLARLSRDLLRVSRHEIEIHSFVCPISDDRTIGAVIKAIQGFINSIDILFVHADGKGQQDKTFAERIGPIAAAYDTERLIVVGVVPIHETEAWALADGDALRRSFGTTLSDSDLGIPGGAGEIERLVDPKQHLRDAQRRAMGGRRHRRIRNELPLPLLGEAIGLDQLRRLPAFRRLEEDTKAALSDLRFLP